MADTTYQCIDCKKKMPITKEISVGDMVVCLNCGAEYEIEKTQPLELQIIEEEK